MVEPTQVVERDTADRLYRLDGVSHVAANINAQVDEPMISAFVERWRPETHTFHMPFGLPVDGLAERFRVLPDNATEDTVMIYARAYIMMLLGTQLFRDNSGARLHIRWLPFVARWGGYLPQSDEKNPRVLQMRHRLDMLRGSDFVWVPYSALEVVVVIDASILEERHTLVWRSVTTLIYFGIIEWHQVDRVLPQFGGFAVHPHPGPDQEFLDWWKGLPHRFLSPPELLGDPRHEQVDSVVATRGSQIPPHRTQVPDVPDRRRAETRRRVGTRMSQRDEGGGGDGAERVRRAQFRQPGERRLRVRARGRGQGGVGVAGAAEGHAEGDAGYVPPADDQVGGGLVSPHRLYPDIANPGTMERQLGGEVCYSDLAAIWAQDYGEDTSSHHVVGTPDFHVDLNEPTSGYHDVWFSLRGTPPSAYPGVGPSHSLVQDPPVQDPPVQERSEDEVEVPLVRRGRRVPRRRGCGTGGHM
ncbi:hypothetical protein PIB30_020865 [Stylosanthes scabra]|uniref:Aminotransferase-like plant mobile domain-containing protein n=1 Tax=Stylosanthes scabra TaxID=79078 RepID=A0ABU6W8J4_9FABA|nr:hypothetical protein [Stylosanthes scabra]